MSIQPIEHGSTQGLQVRVFRAGKVRTRFLAYRKHGGIAAAWDAARRLEAEMETQAGTPSPSRRKGFHATTPNRNSSSGVPGVRAFVLARPGYRPVLHFSTSWCSGPPTQRVVLTLQRSSAAHGLLGALGQVLAARETGTGLVMPSPRAAWARIKRNMGLR